MYGVYRDHPLKIMAEPPEKIHILRRLLLPLSLVVLASVMVIMAALYNAVEYYSVPCGLSDAMTTVIDNLPLKGSDLINSTILNQYYQDDAQLQQLLDALVVVANCSQTMVPMHTGFSDGLYLSMTLSTGAGFGFITPHTNAGKWIATFNSFIGLTVCLFCYILLGKVMWHTARYFLNYRYFNRHRKLKSVTKIIILGIVGHVLFLIIPSAIIMAIEAPHRWSYLDTYYCLLTTVGSIGLGDFIPAKFVFAPWVEAYRIALYCYFILGCAYIVCFIRAIIEELDLKKFPIIEEKLEEKIFHTHHHHPHHPNGVPAGHFGQRGAPWERAGMNRAARKPGSYPEMMSPSAFMLRGRNDPRASARLSGDRNHEERRRAI